MEIQKTTTFDEEVQIRHARENKVVKDNRLINNVSRRKYELTVLEQKTLAYIISKIKPEEVSDLPTCYRVHFEIQDFCKVTGIDETNGNNYRHIKKALENIADKGFWLEHEGGELYFQWIITPDIFKNKGAIEVDIAPKIIPYLVALRERFVEYELWQVLGLKGKYSIPIFELCKSNAYRKRFNVLLSELRKYLGIEEDKYKEYKEFKRNILTPAITEINNYTSIDLAIEGIRTGRKYTHIEFSVSIKDGWEGAEAYRRVTAEINGIKHDIPGQTHLFE